MSRPFSPDEKSQVVDYLCQYLARAVPMTVICRDEVPPEKVEEGDLPRPEFLPDPATVWRWEQDSTEFAQSIACARERGEECLLEECLAIADTPQLGMVEKYEQVEIENPDGPGSDRPAKVREFQVTERRMEDMLGHRKLQIDTRLKLLAKFNPRRWGDYQRVDHDLIGTLADDLNAARERALARRASGGAGEAEADS